ncbi:MAG: hypothetical protein LBQ51_00730 [Desulfovibrio sp.]|nr:hypothetical protein [Desulfovibrio sp.]
MKDTSRTKGAELLNSLAAIVDDELRRGGTEELGERVAYRVAREWGGQKLYMPMDKDRRARMMYRLFNGRNYQQLVREFGRSDTTVRRIVEKERDRQRKAERERARNLEQQYALF